MPTNSGGGKQPQHEEHATTENSGRQKLINAAMKLFGEKGHDKTSLDELAAEAGVSKGLVHKYFGGKSGLRDATDHYVAGRRRAMFETPLHTIRNGHIGDAFGQNNPEFAEEEQLTANYMRGRLWEPPSQATRDYLKNVFDMYREELDHLHQQGLLRDGVEDFDAYAMSLAYLGLGRLLFHPLGLEILNVDSKEKRVAFDDIQQSILDHLLLRADSGKSSIN
ncbi:TetR/AcrR family transcriptional regulator [Pseudomaricurvus alkylphenolicus]|uniref:TetR/AcrR family transcriptional regulator n=1 Tax=Pseudomaricurvus alkylphenolicus TaxID=1306991 RepID=UPI001420A3EA|nr:TetR/AcrR family transcriptional regulator [Pseudomaricurvus alkylphenolicus]NIB38267.1 TetR/AcrR family transcriptional regulator [Pseudomaricurvus alkylphenolicus]